MKFAVDKTSSKQPAETWLHRARYNIWLRQFSSGFTIHRDHEKNLSPIIIDAHGVQLPGAGGGKALVSENTSLQSLRLVSLQELMGCF